MNTTEYKKIMNLNYRDYCEYLKKKYGPATCDYFTKSFNKNPKVTRTSEGLVCHHICEDKAIMLSTPEHARNNPFEYQKAHNLVYCDYLEHLLLHILICEEPAEDHNPLEAVGVGGVVNFIVPELNDLYAGWETNQKWRAVCHSKIINDKSVYFELLKRFKTEFPELEPLLYKSFNEVFGLWNSRNNKKIYEQIKSL